MPITEAQLLRIYPNASQRAGVFVPALNRVMQRYKINSPARQAAFLAQIGHESGQLKWVKEIWGPTSRSPDTKAARSWAEPSLGTGNASWGAA
jgi:putative chitinase